MRRRLGYVEGMRGAAALIVCIAHFLQIFLPVVYEGDVAKSWGVGEHAFETSPMNVVVNPNFSVCLFFYPERLCAGPGFHGRTAGVSQILCKRRRGSMFALSAS
jgi:hypothetical protein